MKIRTKLFVLALTALFASCGTVEEYVLINDVEVREYPTPQRNDLRIKRGDDLQILVSHKLPRIVEEFNRKVNTPGQQDQGSINSYIVNNDGYISFPILDTIKVVGLTCAELEHKISNLISEEGLAEGATCSVKIKNFKVTLIGEGSRGVYEFSDENVTIFDLVAKAGIATGKDVRRDKILIMRDCDSTMKMDYVSLLSTDIFYSPYYFLQQNDVIYVYPTKETIRRSNQIFDFWLSRISIFTTAASTVALFLSIYNRTNGSK